MTTQLHILQNDHFLQNFISGIDKVKQVYKTIFFYIGYVGVLIVSLLLSPIIYTIVLLGLALMIRNLRNDLKKLVVKIDENNYEEFKIQYDKTTEAVNTLNNLNLKSTKIPFLLKPIVNQIISINDIFIGFQQKLSVAELYLEEQNIFMEMIPDIEEPLTKNYKKAMLKQSNKSIQKFLEEEEPFIF